jgi:hypothetical protein
VTGEKGGLSDVGSPPGFMMSTTSGTRPDTTTSHSAPRQGSGRYLVCPTRCRPTARPARQSAMPKVRPIGPRGLGSARPYAPKDRQNKPEIMRVPVQRLVLGDVVVTRP